MYTVTVDEFHTFSFENRDSALRFISIVQNMGDDVVWQSSDVFESCEDAIKEYRKIREAQELVKQYNVQGGRCTYSGFSLAPCCVDIELSCDYCEYWKH